MFTPQTLSKHSCPFQSNDYYFYVMKTTYSSIFCCFSFDDNSDTRSRKDLFLAMKEKLDPTSAVQNDRFLEVTNQILEKVKATKKSRMRSASACSVTSSQGGKRGRSKENTSVERAAVRPKTSGIPLKH